MIVIYIFLALAMICLVVGLIVSIALMMQTQGGLWQALKDASKDTPIVFPGPMTYRRILNRRNSQERSAAHND